APLFVADLQFAGRERYGWNLIAGDRGGHAAAIDINLNAFREARAVIRDGDVAPFVKRYAALGFHFGARLGSIAPHPDNDVAPFLTAVIQRDFIARPALGRLGVALQNRHARRTFRLQPQRDRERLPRIESAHLSERKLRLFLQIGCTADAAIRVRELAGDDSGRTERIFKPILG